MCTNFGISWLIRVTLKLTDTILRLVEGTRDLIHAGKINVVTSMPE